MRSEHSRGEPDGPRDVLAFAQPRAEDSKGRAFLSRFLPIERRIFGYILTLVPERSEAEDLLQETSLVMWEKFDPADPPDDLLAWGCRIAYFQVQHHRRSWRRRVRFSELLLERLAESAREKTEALRLDERSEVLSGCLEKLPARDRALLAERLREGATTQSTAERLGRSTDAVYKTMAKIRRLLADCVARSLERDGRP